MTRRRVRVNRATVLHRIKSGDALYLLDYGGAAFGNDDRPGVGVLAKLIKTGRLVCPINIGEPFALGKEENV